MFENMSKLPTQDLSISDDGMLFRIRKSINYFNTDGSWAANNIQSCKFTREQVIDALFASLDERNGILPNGTTEEIK